MTEQEKQALITSLRILAATSKSRKVLKRKLIERGFDEIAIEKTLDHLEKQGLINDRAFAQSVFQTLSHHRPSGRRRIEFELEKRGVEARLIEEVLGEFGATEEREKALGLAKQKYDRWKNLDKLKRRKRIYDFLVRRGFGFTISREVISEVESAKD